jgi:hypothetical protein
MRPWWCVAYPAAWEAMVDRWLAPEWAEAHKAAQQRRLLMPGVPHHQGNRNLVGYAQAWVHVHVSILMFNHAIFIIILLSFSQLASHGGQECS